MKQVPLPAPAPLIFVRHGKTAWNVAGRFQGAKDIPLNQAGFQDAHKNADQIRKFMEDEGLVPEAVTLISSPLVRASKTAEIIADDLSFSPPALWKEFKEVSVGRWEGLTSQQVKDQFYQERKSRKSDPWNFKSQGGESMAERSKDIASALTRLSPNTVVVTHSVIIRILWQVLGDREADQAAQMLVPHVGLLLWDGKTLQNIY